MYQCSTTPPLRRSQHATDCFVLCTCGAESQWHRSAAWFIPAVHTASGSYLRRGEPVTALLGMVHGGVEIVEEAVLEELVVDEVELTPRVVVRLVVADSREVEPLGVSELVACS